MVQTSLLLFSVVALVMLFLNIGTEAECVNKRKNVPLIDECSEKRFFERRGLPVYDDDEDQNDELYGKRGMDSLRRKKDLITSIADIIPQNQRLMATSIGTFLSQDILQRIHTLIDMFRPQLKPLVRRFFDLSARERQQAIGTFADLFPPPKTKQIKIIAGLIFPGKDQSLGISGFKQLIQAVKNLF